MTDCIECGRSLQDREVRGMLAAACKTHGEMDRAKPVIAVATDWQLSQPEHYMRLADELAAMDLPRRRVRQWVEDAIYCFDGEIVQPNGQALQIDDTFMDRAFGDDWTYRWISSFQLVRKRPWRYAPQQRVINRLRLIDLALRIKGADLSS